MNAVYATIGITGPRVVGYNPYNRSSAEVPAAVLQHVLSGDPDGSLQALVLAVAYRLGYGRREVPAGVNVLDTFRPEQQQRILREIVAQIGHDMTRRPGG